MGEEPEGSQRRLVAILSMDAVGYSRLMAADEAGGRVVDNPGDNVLCEFPAMTSAVACALEILRALGVWRLAARGRCAPQRRPAAGGAGVSHPPGVPAQTRGRA